MSQITRLVCAKHGIFHEMTFCPVCEDLEIAQTLKWEEERELQEDLEDSTEFANGLACVKEGC